ncbi:hypothetical protein BGX27_007941 [Mortierella sp. AM989]|nr:hypothetical protein BGX27_007941 [Mortierella sp. AM989]
MELKRSREEKAWERRLIQQIMGITSIMDTDTQLDQQRHQYEQSSVSSFQLSPSALSNRTKVHLLMKAPSGLVFQGILPKQMVTVQEDYSLNDIEAAKANSNSSSAAPISGGKKRRWPIHHIHVFGPAPSHTPSSLSSTPVPALDTQNEIWYQVGPGIPVLSPLL